MRDTIKKHEDFIAKDNAPVAKSAYFLVRAKYAIGYGLMKNYYDQNGTMSLSHAVQYWTQIEQPGVRLCVKP